MTDTESTNPTNRRIAPFSHWMPSGALSYLRERSDLYLLDQVSFDAGGEQPSTEQLLLSMYVELLSAVRAYLYAIDDEVESSISTDESHQIWIEFLHRQKLVRLRELDAKSEYGKRSAFEEFEWQHSIAKRAWDECLQLKRNPGLKVFRRHCEKLASKDGRPKQDIDRFTTHYCRKKLKSFKAPKLASNRGNWLKIHGRRG